MSDETADNTFHDELLAVEQLLRSLTDDDLGAPETPPPSVWAGIERELAATGQLTAAAVTHGSAPVAPAQVTSLAEHRARRDGRYRWLAAAAAVVVVTGAVAVVATRDGDDEAVVAVADLTWESEFDPWAEGASATAELVRADGGYQIVLRDSSLPADLEEDADLELWLISTDADGKIADVQPVQKLTGGPAGTFAVPADLDPNTYTVVDISIEPRDGDEQHSGNSVLRGELQA